MKNFMLIILGLILLNSCSTDNKEDETFPPFKITEHSADSSVITLEYEEYKKRFNKNLKYKKIITRGEFSDSEKEKLALSTFSDFIDDKKLKHETDYLGINVSEAEKENYLWGDNIHEKIKSLPMFINAETDEFDKSKVKPFVRQISANKTSSPYFVWQYLIDEINNELIKEKYESLLINSLIFTETEEKWYNRLYTGKSSAKITAIPYKNYQNIPEPTDEEYLEYLQEYDYNYQIYENRYLTAAAVPLTIHKHFHEKEYKSLKRQLETLKDFNKVANQNNEIKKFSSFYYEKSLPNELKALFKNGKPGDIHGPYYDKNSYRVVKFDKTQMVPDEAKAQHLLLRGMDKSQVNAIKKSIITRVKNGEDFLAVAKELSEKYEEDGRWGDLGWFRYAKMEKEFSDSVFLNKPGTYPISKTRYGWHIINIQEHKNLKKQFHFTALYWPLSPSEKDIEASLQEASSFAATIKNPDNFKKKATDKQYLIENYEAIAPGSRIEGLENSKQVYDWAFHAFEGNLSKPYYLEGKIYLFKLEKIAGPGTMPLSAVKKLIAGDIKKQYIKKAIKKQFNIDELSKEPIEKIAQTINNDYQTVTGITFAQNEIVNFGTNPFLIGLIRIAKIGEQSKILFGDENAYVFQKTNEKNIELSINHKKRQSSLWKTDIYNDVYREVFKLHDNMTINQSRKQDSYFLVPSYTDTLPDDKSLSKKMFEAEIAFRNEEFTEALEGTDGFKGFAELANSKPSKQQRLAALYGGLSALKAAKYTKAIELLEKVKTQDRFFSVIAKGAQGDAYLQLGQQEKAIEKYKEAVNANSNFFINPKYLMKIAAIYAQKKNNDEILKQLYTIKELYPQSIIQRELDKYIAVYEYLTNKEKVMAKIK